MTNAEKFEQIFGLYATELWAKPEEEFLEWLNAETEPEREKGKWLLFDGYRCSICNYKLQTTGIPQYCPNCGADMI